MLRETPVLCLDIQTTDTQASRGHILEVAWLVGSPESGVLRRQSSLVALPEEESLPPAVAELTGITPQDLASAPPLEAVLAGLCAESASLCLIHYARFESAFLRERAMLPAEVFCTHQMSRKLLPELPAWGIRAVRGYFGDSLAGPQRAAAHAEATWQIWNHFVPRLAERDIVTADSLRDWIRRKEKAPARRRSYLVSRETRLALPRSPGVYRMIATDGTVLYVGKATCLRSRVSSYFRERTKGALRLSEMLAQVADVQVTPTSSPLEAALLETDEIKHWNPRYNTSLRTGQRSLHFSSPDFRELSDQPDAAHPFGPLTSAEPIARLNALVDILEGRAPAELIFEELEDPTVLEEGIRLALPEDLPRTPRALLRWAYGLPEEEEAEEGDETEEWTAKRVARRIRRSLTSTARLLRRGHRICRLLDCRVRWEEADGSPRGLSVEGGRVTADGEGPPGWRRGAEERKGLLDVATYDRMRTLLTEMRALLDDQRPVELRLAPHLVLRQERLRRWLG